MNLKKNLLGKTLVDWLTKSWWERSPKKNGDKKNRSSLLASYKIVTFVGYVSKSKKKSPKVKKVTKSLKKTRLLKLSKTSRIVTAFNRHKKPDKEGRLKFSLTVFIVTTFSESQNLHKFFTNGHICDGHNVTDSVI
jgi:hypothetical protein